MGPKRRGWTVVDCVVLLCVGALMLAAVGRLAVNNGDRSNRIRCANDLRQIGISYNLYSTCNRSYPRTAYVPDAPLTQYTGVHGADPFRPDGVASNDVTAAAYLLCRTVDLSPENLICPSGTAQVMARDPLSGSQTEWNFAGEQCLSYSFGCAYPTQQALKNGYTYPPSNPKQVLAADMNPGGEALLTLSANSAAGALREGNSRNHYQEGQNILYKNGMVSWSETPFCGVSNDNIYTYGAGGTSVGIGGASVDANDSALLPVSTVQRPLPESRLWSIVGVVLSILFIGGMAISEMRSRRKSAASAAARADE